MAKAKRLHKVGGLWHWRIGRVGGSFYLSKRGEPRSAIRMALPLMPFGFAIGMVIGSIILRTW